MLSCYTSLHPEQKVSHHEKVQMQAETAPDILSTAFQPSDSAAPEIVRSILEKLLHQI